MREFGYQQIVFNIPSFLTIDEFQNCISLQWIYNHLQFIQKKKKLHKVEGPKIMLLRSFVGVMTFFFFFRQLNVTWWTCCTFPDMYLNRAKYSFERLLKVNHLFNKWVSRSIRSSVNKLRLYPIGFANRIGGFPKTVSMDMFKRRTRDRNFIVGVL